MDARANTVPPGSWIAQVATAFHVLAVTLLGEPRVEAIEASIASIPAARTPIETVVLRCFAYDTLVQLSESRSPIDALNGHGVASFSTIRQSKDVVRDLSAILQAVLADPAAARGALADRVRRYIDARLSERITVRSLAERFDITPTRLSRLFKTRVGVSIPKYVRMTRVQVGLQLVADGNKVEAAALLVGYRSKKNFYHAVRVRTGTTPTALRRAARG